MGLASQPSGKAGLDRRCEVRPLACGEGQLAREVPFWRDSVVLRAGLPSAHYVAGLPLYFAGYRVPVVTRPDVPLRPGPKCGDGGTSVRFDLGNRCPCWTRDRAHASTGPQAGVWW